MFERVGNSIYCYEDGVQQGSTFDCTGDNIGAALSGDAVVAVGGSINNAVPGIPPAASYIDAFQMKIRENIYGGVAPGSPSTEAPVSSVETFIVGDPTPNTQIDGATTTVTGDLVVDGTASAVGSFTIFDAGLTDSVTFTHTGSDFDISAVNTNVFEFGAVSSYYSFLSNVDVTADLFITGGNQFQIFDSSALDWVKKIA